MAEDALTVEVFARDGELGLMLPREVADRYHLAPGVQVAIAQVEEGIVLTPLGVEPWFSPEWERALDMVVEHYREVLEMLGEPEPE
jgi:hypothetical protein